MRVERGYNMKKNKILLSLSLTAALISINAYSFDMKGTITAKAATTKAVYSRYNALTAASSNKAAMPSFKQVTLMKVNLTRKEKQKFVDFQPSMATAASKQPLLPDKVDQGMNNVPVLDQGRHGTCVTFATTAAIDALLGKGDYISQLCNLELGDYLADNGYRPGGWDGSLGPMVLDQMLAFGMVSKQNQKEKTCAGKTEYPIANPDDVGQKMKLEEFKQLSEALDEKLYWEPILTVPQRVLDPLDHGYDAEKVFMEVKKALATKLQYRQTRVHLVCCCL